MENTFSHNAELPGGRSPFWIKDHGLLGIGLAPGDAVSIDSGIEPTNGDLVLVEVDVDGDSQKLVRRYFEHAGQVTLTGENPDVADIHVAADQLLLLGVVKSRVRFEAVDEDRVRIVEQPLG